MSQWLVTIALGVAVIRACAADGAANPDVLAADLGHSSPQLRCLAMDRLRTLGKAAGPALLRQRARASDRDALARIETLIAELAISTDEVEANADAAIARLLNAPPAQRDEAARWGLSLPPRGAARFKEGLLAPLGAIRARAVAPAWVDDPGDLNVHLVISNVSGSPVLLNIAALRAGHFETRPTCAWTPLAHARSAIVPHPARPRDSMPPVLLATAERIPGGESISIPVAGDVSALLFDLIRVGRNRFTWDVDLDSEFLIDGKLCAFGVRGGSLQVTAEVALFPSPADDDSVIRDAILTLGHEGFGAEGAANVTMLLRNAGAKPLRVDALWPRYTWVSVRGRDNGTLVCGPASDFGHPVPHSDERLPLDLGPGSVVRYRMAVQLPKVATTLWLDAAYEHFPGRQRDSLADVDAQGYALGAARASRVSISAPEGAKD